MFIQLIYIYTCKCQNFSMELCRDMWKGQCQYTYIAVSGCYFLVRKMEGYDIDNIQMCAYIYISIYAYISSFCGELVHWHKGNLINHIRADSRFAPSQWETKLLCNDVSHWLGASLESALILMQAYNTMTIVLNNDHRNQHQLDCLLNNVFRLTKMKMSKPALLKLCEWHPLVIASPHEGSVMRVKVTMPWLHCVIVQGPFY